MDMYDVSNLSSILQNSLLSIPYGIDKEYNSQWQKVQENLSNLPSVLDKNTLTKLKNGGYDITLQQYTSMNSYNTMMNALYGNNSANTFQNTLNKITNSAEDELANAKKFVNAMKENGMSNQTAVKTYSALKKYSLMSSFGNYNFVKAKA